MHRIKQYIARGRNNKPLSEMEPRPQWAEFIAY
jgi:hypothetical protein